MVSAIRGISMGTQEKQILMMRVDFKPVSKPKGQSIKNIQMAIFKMDNPQGLLYSLGNSAHVTWQPQ